MVFFDFMIMFITYFILVICVLVSVAFLTLFERKILGYIQVRKGPNKTGFMGLAQPFSDALKLFSKEQISPLMSNYFWYYLSPVFMMLISLIIWSSFPVFSGFLNFNYSLLFIFCVSSMGVYGIMMAGWSSNSNYSLLGSLRSIAQTISYEVSLIMIMLSFMVMVFNYSIIEFSFFQIYTWFIIIFFPLGLMIFVTFLAETNRTPFDLAEGESELVSGFNTEYSSGGFAMIFLAEYSSILFMSFLFSMIMLGGDYYMMLFYYKIMIMSFLWIWVRGSYPRFRYDHLMNMTWMNYLPVSLLYLIFYLNFILYIFN